MTIGQRIRKRRETMKLTQQQLGNTLGVTAQHISAIEKDKRAPSLDSLARLAEELGVTVDFLVTGKEGVITDPIPAIRADKKLKIEIKRALVTLIRAIYAENEEA
jgi:transcriptional regulator with XRE-family HTH domain